MAAAPVTSPPRAGITKKKPDEITIRFSSIWRPTFARNWIGFALPASVREIKGRQENPRDSLSSR